MQYSQWDAPPMMNTPPPPPPPPPASQWNTPPTNVPVQLDQNRPNENPGNPCKPKQTVETIQKDLNGLFFLSIIPIIVFIGLLFYYIKQIHRKFALINNLLVQINATIVE
jgi:hypothetical protein